jgi:hypothetical protein
MDETLLAWLSSLWVMKLNAYETLKWNFALSVGVSSEFYFIVYDMAVLETTTWNYPLRLPLCDSLLNTNKTLIKLSRDSPNLWWWCSALEHEVDSHWGCQRADVPARQADKCRDRIAWSHHPLWHQATKCSVGCMVSPEGVGFRAGEAARPGLQQGHHDSARNVGYLVPDG